MNRTLRIKCIRRRTWRQALSAWAALFIAIAISGCGGEPNSVLAIGEDPPSAGSATDGAGPALSAVDSQDQIQGNSNEIILRPPSDDPTLPGSFACPMTFELLQDGAPLAEPVTGFAPMTLTLSAVPSNAQSLPAGSYVWWIDGVATFGSVESHASLAFTLNEPGGHSLSMSYIGPDDNRPRACRTTTTNAVVIIAVVHEMEDQVTDDPVCGDGEIQDSETCDDGNVTDGDGCDRFCQTEPDEESIPIAARLNLGTGFTPAGMPNSTQAQVQDYFELAGQVGDHVMVLTQWTDAMTLLSMTQLQTLAAARGLAFHVYLSPISVDPPRDQPAIPPSVPGNSFSDATVRAAYIDWVLEAASIDPDVLGIASEANLLAQNPQEFDAYVSLAEEAYTAVKAAHPTQNVTISFSWGAYHNGVNQFLATPDSITAFDESLDIYSFTTYPFAFLSGQQVPADYYGGIRALLPAARVGFAEVGWSSAGASSESQQASFVAGLPELMAVADPEFVTIIQMHDIPAHSGADAVFNHVGLRHSDGSPKPAWFAAVGVFGGP